jgi:transposase-like protein
MTGQKSGLVARIREINPKITWQHCIIHRESLVAKKITPDLHETLNIAVKVVNLIKSRALNSRLLKKMCEEVGSTHTLNCFC